VRLYSNPAGRDVPLRRVRHDALSVRPAEGPRRPRQRQRRLGMAEVMELIKAYEQQESIKELAQRFGIHRTTVTSLLRRHGVALRRSGLAPADVAEATHLYRHGWSLARLGAEFGVDPTTVWWALHAAGVVMRPPGQAGKGASELLAR
jgi:hypothetical protein